MVIDTQETSSQLTLVIFQLNEVRILNFICTNLEVTYEEYKKGGAYIIPKFFSETWINYFSIGFTRNERTKAIRSLRISKTRFVFLERILYFQVLEGIS